MFFRQYELGCLSVFSYMIGDTTSGRAVVIDPQRDISAYLEDAAAQDLQIERIIETHVHADFVSGHLELARATGATISYGAGVEPDFPTETLVDGQRLDLGAVVLEVRATPGHTPESISIVVFEHRDDQDPWGVLTGDTLFIGDVGRPDLLVSAGISAEDLARKLYHSLHGQLLTLPDATRVFPAHGAGSSCGRSLAAASSSTIGEQRRTNYALQLMTEEAFVTAVTTHQPVAPLYFEFAAIVNRSAHPLLEDGSTRIPPLRIDEVIQHQLRGAVVVDGRPPQTFASGHLRGSLNVSLDGRFAEHAGTVIRPDRPIIVVADAGREVEAKVRLARIGFDGVIGYLPDIDQTLADQPHRAARAARLPVTELAAWIDADDEVQVLDVRNPSEHEAGTIPGASLVPLPLLLNAIRDLDSARPTVLVCATGNRSSIAASLLRAEGFDEVADVLGGFQAWTAADLPVVLPRH